MPTTWHDMTIAVAVKVVDGIVLAADSATTLTLPSGDHQVYNNADILTAVVSIVLRFQVEGMVQRRLEPDRSHPRAVTRGVLDHTAPVGE